jgi:hypothetical protein
LNHTTLEFRQALPYHWRMGRFEKLLKLVEVGAIARAAASREWSDAVSIVWFSLSIEPHHVAELDEAALDENALDLIKYAMHEGPRPAWYRDAR